jgi:hypothetical protein
MEIRIAELSRRRFQTIDLVARIELDPFQRQAILGHYEDLFLLVDRRPAFDIEGMNRDKSHLVIAFDPANRRNVVSFGAYTPDIMMSPLNPASGVTYGPTPRN